MTWNSKLFRNASRIRWKTKERIEKKTVHALRSDKKETQTSLLSTSAACSEESAGCQTLKGTEAEFNASCQGMLMWLSPPARAGIVKLSDAGKDAQNSTAGCPSVCPYSWNIAVDTTGGMKHPLCSPMAAWVHPRMCQFKLCPSLFYC